MKKYISIFLLFSACTKHAGDIADHVPAATLTISKPAEGEVYNIGDSISIQGMALSSETIHGYDVIVKRANDTTTYFSIHIHTHNDTLLIDQKWKTALTKATALEAVVTLALDHDGHTLTRRVGCSIK